MTETGRDVVKRLNAFVSNKTHLVTLRLEDAAALLAVVEAAQEVDKMWPSKNWSKHYSKPVIRLKESLAALHSQDDPVD